MGEFNDWELHKAPYIDEDGTVETTVRKWEHSETFNALDFIAEIRSELDGLDPEACRSAEIYFHTWTDVDGCPSRCVNLTYRRPATDRELRLDKAKQLKAVEDDRAWLQQRLATLIEDAGRAGVAVADLGITVFRDGYTFASKKSR